jgi:hypothetical protein
MSGSCAPAGACELSSYSPPKNIAEDGCVTNANGNHNCDGKYHGSNIDWRNYVAAYASHLVANTRGVHVSGYELYNEFTRQADFSGTPSWLGTDNQMLRMAEDANCIITGTISAVHATGETCAQVRATVTSVTLSGPVDPTALMGTPSSNDFGSASYLTHLNSYLNNTCGGTCANAPAAAADYLALHTYSHNNSRTALAEATFTDFQSFYGGITNTAIKAKPVWSTEGNYGGWGNLPSLEMEAGYVAKYFVLLNSLNFQKVYFYGYDANYCSPTQPNGGEGCLWIPNGAKWGGTSGTYFTCTLAQGCLLQAGTAYQFMVQWLDGATQTSACSNTSGTLWTCGYTLSGGVPALLVWDSSKSCTNGSGCTTTPYPASGNLSAQWTQYSDVYGNVTNIPSGTKNVPIGYNPILLQAATVPVFTLTSQQPVSPAPYSSNANSVTSKPLPSDIMQHCYGNTSNCAAGDAIAKCALTDCGGVKDTPVPQYMGVLFFASPGNSDNEDAVYYSCAGPPNCSTADPYGKVVASTPTGNQTIVFRFPSGAKFPEGAAGGSGDECQITVWDQSTGWVVGFYRAGGCGAGTTLPVASGCGSTQAAACVIPSSGCISGATNLFTGQDYGYKGSSGTAPQSSDQFAPTGGMVRHDELRKGGVFHALIFTTNCINPANLKVFPVLSGGFLGQCPAGFNPNRPPAGALLFLDYTPAQISSFSLPEWQTTMLKAMSANGGYGGYIGITSGGGALSIRGNEEIESSEAWKYYFPSTFLSADPIWAWANAQKGLDGTLSLSATGCFGGSGTNPSTYRCEGAMLSNIPRTVTVGSTSVDAEGNACGSGLGCYPSGHIHMADKCIALGYANQPGGCF